MAPFSGFLVIGGPHVLDGGDRDADDVVGDGY